MWVEPGLNFIGSIFHICNTQFDYEYSRYLPNTSHFSDSMFPNHHFHNKKYMWFISYLDCKTNAMNQEIYTEVIIT